MTSYSSLLVNSNPCFTSDSQCSTRIRCWLKHGFNLLCCVRMNNRSKIKLDSTIATNTPSMRLMLYTLK